MDPSWKLQLQFCLLLLLLPLSTLTAQTETVSKDLVENANDFKPNNLRRNIDHPDPASITSTRNASNTGFTRQNIPNLVAPGLWGPNQVNGFLGQAGQVLGTVQSLFNGVFGTIPQVNNNNGNNMPFGGLFQNLSNSNGLRPGGLFGGLFNNQNGNGGLFGTARPNNGNNGTGFGGQRPGGLFGGLFNNQNGNGGIFGVARPINVDNGVTRPTYGVPNINNGIGLGGQRPGGLFGGLFNNQNGNGGIFGAIRPNNVNNGVPRPTYGVPNNGGYLGTGLQPPINGNGWTGSGGNLAYSPQYTNWRNIGLTVGNIGVTVGRIVQLKGRGAAAALKTVSQTLQGLNEGAKGFHSAINQNVGHSYHPAIPSFNPIPTNNNDPGWTNNGISEVPNFNSVPTVNNDNGWTNNGISEVPNFNSVPTVNNDHGWTNNGISDVPHNDYNMPHGQGYSSPDPQAYDSQLYNRHNNNKHNNFGRTNSPSGDYGHNEVLVLKSPGNIEEYSSNHN